MSSLRSLLLDTQTRPLTGDINFTGLESIDSNGAVLVAEQRWAELSELSLNINHLVHIRDGLEDIKESVEASLQEGGLDRAGAALMVSSSKALMLPLEHSIPMPSLERFGGRGERIGSTHIAIEALKDKIDKIWEAIKKAFERLRVKVMNWYKAIFDSVTKIKNRADKIMEEAKNIDSSPEKDSFDFVIERITHDGKDVDNLSKDMDSLIAMASGVLSSLYNSLTTKAANGFTEAIRSVSVKSAEDIVATMEKFYTVVNSFNTMLKGLPMKLNTSSALAANFEANKAFGSTDEIDYFKGEDLPGNKAFYYGQPKAISGAAGESIGFEADGDGDDGDGDDGDPVNPPGGGALKLTETQKNRIVAISQYFSHISKMGYKLSEADENRDIDKDKVDIKTPTALTIEGLAKKVNTLMDHVGKFKETSEKVSKTKSDLLKKGDDLAKKIADNKFMEAENPLFSLVSLPKDVANIIDGPGNEIVSLSVSISNVVLNYCQAALACYK